MTDPTPDPDADRDAEWDAYRATRAWFHSTVTAAAFRSILDSLRIVILEEIDAPPAAADDPAIAAALASAAASLLVASRLDALQTTVHVAVESFDPKTVLASLLGRR